jgi:hypothetical protein
MWMSYNEPMNTSRTMRGSRRIIGVNRRWNSMPSEILWPKFH